jgi:hypothetical protein
MRHAVDRDRQRRRTGSLGSQALAAAGSARVRVLRTCRGADVRRRRRRGRVYDLFSHVGLQTVRTHCVVPTPADSEIDPLVLAPEHALAPAHDDIVAGT